MTIQEIYDDFKIPQNLQEHMLRVAALAHIILNHWTGEGVDKSAIIQASLLHDIAKPLTFDLNKQFQFGLSEEDIVELTQLQKRLKDNYGSVEHEATVQICKEVGCSKPAIEVMKNWHWENTTELMEENNLPSLIAIYSDTRIAPHGLVTVKERIKDLKKRREYWEKLDELGRAVQKLEQKLQQCIALKLEKITNENLQPGIRELSKYKFKKEVR